MRIRACFAAAALLMGAWEARAAEIMPANNAPYTIDNPTRRGFLLDIVKHMETTLGLSYPVKFMGWKDVQATAAAAPGARVQHVALPRLLRQKRQIGCYQRPSSSETSDG